MADTPKNYESTVMRMAGNIAAGIAPLHSRTYIKGHETWEIANKQLITDECVKLARMIVAEVHRTAPRKDGQ